MSARYTAVTTSVNIGETFQTVERVHQRGRAIWHITVHQRLNNGTFDTPDAFAPDGATLLPLRLTTTLNQKPHAHLVYGKGRITGFATLPLSQGAYFRVPNFQYDHGFGMFTVAVTGTEKIRTPGGIVDAWVLDAAPNSAHRVVYFIEKGNRRELGYRFSRGSQQIGGLCHELN